MALAIKCPCPRAHCKGSFWVDLGMNRDSVDVNLIHRMATEAGLTPEEEAEAVREAEALLRAARR